MREARFCWYLEIFSIFDWMWEGSVGNSASTLFLMKKIITLKILSEIILGSGSSLPVDMETGFSRYS